MNDAINIQNISIEKVISVKDDMDKSIILAVVQPSEGKKRKKRIKVLNQSSSYITYEILNGKGIEENANVVGGLGKLDPEKIPFLEIGAARISNVKIIKLITETNLYDEDKARDTILNNSIFKATLEFVKKDGNDIRWDEKKDQLFTISREKIKQNKTGESEEIKYQWSVTFIDNGNKNTCVLNDENDQNCVIKALRAACGEIKIKKVKERDLGGNRSDFELISFNGYKRKTPDEEAIVYSVEPENDYSILTGLYCGEIRFEKEYPSLEIRTGYSDTLIKRMIDRCCGIYASSNESTSSSVDADSIYSKIVQYMYMLSLGKVISILVPQRYRNIYDRGYNIRGNVNINEYINRDILIKDKKVSYIYSERREIQNIIDVLYAALKSCKVSTSGSLPNLKNYESYLSGLYSGKRPSISQVRSIQKEKCLKNSLYSAFKRPLELAAILLEKDELTMRGEKDNSGINGILMDSSYLWEQYIEYVMNQYLDGWRVDSQVEITYYKDTFYPTQNRPDFILTSDDDEQNIVILDTKFKKMEFESKDVDNKDIQQVHCYSYYYYLNYGNKFKGTALIYPTKKDITEEQDYKSYDKMFGIETDIVEEQKFGILTLKDVNGIDKFVENDLNEEDLNESEKLDLNERAFIKRLERFLSVQVSELKRSERINV